MPRRTLIMGAAGKDFHVFNTLFRGRVEERVECFTATQIPGIDARRYPAALAGPRSGSSRFRVSETRGRRRPWRSPQSR